MQNVIKCKNIPNNLLIITNYEIMLNNCIRLLFSSSDMIKINLQMAYVLNESNKNTKVMQTSRNTVMIKLNFRNSEFSTGFSTVFAEILITSLECAR